MNIRINGKYEEIDGVRTIDELLVFKNVETPGMVSVELNGVILKREEFGTERLKEGDAVEFLYFMGGGADESLTIGGR